jgi:hypothetical protein
MTNSYGAYSPSHDEVLRQVEKIDHADDSVREAMQQVSANERRERLAGELGSSGVAALSTWHNRIHEVGPRAALEAAQLYQTAPRPPAVVEEEHDDPDHQAAARSAYRSAKQRAERQGDMDSARSGLDQFERRYGSLDVVENSYLPWHQQLTANPMDAGPRIASEIQQRINGAVADQWAAKTVASYGKHISPEEHGLMREILAGNYADDMQTAQAMAKYELALDVDEFGRDAARAKRQMERREMAQAHRELAVFRHHMRPTQRQEDKMKALLESGKAPNLESAWRMIKGYDDKPRRRK